MLVDFAGGDVIVTGQGHGEVSLVVTQVKVDLGAWRHSQYGRTTEKREIAKKHTRAQNKAFTVLSRGHQACIDGDIGIDLDAADSQPKRLQ